MKTRSRHKYDFLASNSPGADDKLTIGASANLGKYFIRREKKKIKDEIWYEYLISLEFF